MGDVIDFTKDSGVYDRSCGECGCSIFTWQTSSECEDEHYLICGDCEYPYFFNGEELCD